MAVFLNTQGAWRDFKAGLIPSQGTLRVTVRSVVPEPLVT
jgi:hypothetical protein